MGKRKQVRQREMTILPEDLPMLRLVEQAMHQAFMVTQDYRTRAVLLSAPTGEVLVHDDVAVIREWLRHYAECGTYGRRCFVNGQHVCACVPGLDRWSISVRGVRGHVRRVKGVFL